MVKKQLFLFITIVVLVGALFFYSFLYISKLYTGIPDNLPSRTPLVEGKASQGVIVTRVIDGDTVELSTGEKVRYIGVDSPEIGKKNECFALQAQIKNNNLVEGKEVRLKKDISEKDRFGRLLRYVWVNTDEGEIFVNEYLVSEGYALVSTFPPDVAHEEELISAQDRARNQNKGLWGECKRKN